MFPLFPFAIGLVVGAAGIKLVRTGKAKKQIEEAQSYLRSATVSGLSAIEQSSARLRDRLQEEPSEAPQEEAPAARRSKPAAKPAAKPAPKRRPAAAKAKAAPAKNKDEA